MIACREKDQERPQYVGAIGGSQRSTQQEGMPQSVQAALAAVMAREIAQRRDSMRVDDDE